MTDVLATLQELEHLGVGFVSITEGLDLTTPAGRAHGRLLAIFAEFERRFCVSARGLVWPMRGRTASGLVGRQRRQSTLLKSGSCIAPALANPKSLAGYESAALRFAGSWQLERRGNGQTVRGGPVKHRERIAAGEKIPLQLTNRELNLIMQHVLSRLSPE